jgi:dTDP-4-amino-4,6-dideoxygalactose transaminase
LEGSGVITPFVPEYAEPVWHLYVVRNSKRDELKEYLDVNGVSTVIHYPTPPHKQECYRDFNEINLPIADLLASEVLSLPISAQISIEQAAYVARNIVNFKNCS